MKKLSFLFAFMAVAVVALYAEKQPDVSEFSIMGRAGSVNGMLTGPQTFQRPVSGPLIDLTCSGMGFNLSGIGNAVFYATHEIYSPTGENLVASVASGNDSYLLLYCAPFNPATPLANLRFADDDDGNVFDAAFLPGDNVWLEPNTLYILVVTFFGNGTTFNYELIVDGNVVFGDPAPAQIFFDGSPGTSAPPATLGGFNMVPFAGDNRPVLQDFSSVPLPFPYAGDIEFAPALNHRKIGIGWLTWSHGYTGSVYFNASPTTPVTITFPAGIRAFYFYAEPNVASIFNIEALGQAGSRTSSVSSGPIPVNGGSGAKYFGFYTDGVAEIAQIIVTAEAAAGGFAVGEFGVFIDDLPPQVPISNWALYLGILLMITFVAIRFRRMI